MNEFLAAGAIVGFAILIGLAISTDEVGIPELDELRAGETKENDSSDSSKDVEEGGNSSLEFGTSHEHALFYLIHNQSEVSFQEDRYQLASKYVHLENGNSNIVHKHSENVTWNYFFDTIDLNVSENGNRTYCLDVKDIDYCGEAGVELNGEKANLSKEIQQGDKLVIVLQEDFEAILEDYLSKQLPRDYKPSGTRGRRL